MNYQFSLKHLFNKVIIPNSLNNKMILEYEKNKTIPNHNRRPFSSFNSNKSILAERRQHKNVKLRNFSNSRKKKNKLIQFNSLKKGGKLKLLHYNSDLEYCTNTTQTPTITDKSKNLVNSFRNRFSSMNIKKRNLKNDKNILSSYFNNKDNFNFDNNLIKNNNICIGSNINKTINNVIVDNNMDLLREFKFQTINNFNNKYKLKFKLKIPEMHNKICDIFSLLKQKKYEEEKKLDSIQMFINEKPKKNKKRKKNNEIFNEKVFEKNFSLIENDFDIKKKLKDSKKFVFIHTLNLLKK